MKEMTAIVITKIVFAVGSGRSISIPFDNAAQLLVKRPE
jgi:hypothetical protein